METRSEAPPRRFVRVLACALVNAGIEREAGDVVMLRQDQIDRLAPEGYFAERALHLDAACAMLDGDPVRAADAPPTLDELAGLTGFTDLTADECDNAWGAYQASAVEG